MTRLAFVLLAAMTALAGCGKKTGVTDGPPTEPGAPDKPKPAPIVSDRDRAQGVWVVAKLEWPEADARRAPPKGELDTVVVTIKGDRVTITFDGTVGDMSHVLFTEDAAKSPRQVNMIGTDGPDSREPLKHKIMGVGKDGKPTVVSTFTHPPLKAIYKFAGETLVVAFPVEPGADRPTAFTPAMVQLPAGKGPDESAVVVLHLKKK